MGMRYKLNKKCQTCPMASIATMTFNNISHLHPEDFHFVCSAGAEGDCLDGADMNIEKRAMCKYGHKHYLKRFTRDGVFYICPTCGAILYYDELIFLEDEEG